MGTRIRLLFPSQFIDLAFFPHHPPGGPAQLRAAPWPSRGRHPLGVPRNCAPAQPPRKGGREARRGLDPAWGCEICRLPDPPAKIRAWV